MTYTVSAPDYRESAEWRLLAEFAEQITPPGLTAA